MRPFALITGSIALTRRNQRGTVRDQRKENLIEALSGLRLWLLVSAIIFPRIAMAGADRNLLADGSFESLKQSRTYETSHNPLRATAFQSAPSRGCSEAGSPPVSATGHCHHHRSDPEQLRPQGNQRQVVPSHCHFFSNAKRRKPVNHTIARNACGGYVA